MEFGVCPVCNGSGHMKCPDHLRRYGQNYNWYGYRAEDDTVDCMNCGAQYMFGQPTGQVKLRPDGTPCTHDYYPQKYGVSLTKYTCVHCGDAHNIDSGD
jgi:transcription elongation factor Elf1